MSFHVDTIEFRCVLFDPFANSCYFSTFYFSFPNYIHNIFFTTISSHKEYNMRLEEKYAIEMLHCIAI